MKKHVCALCVLSVLAGSVLGLFAQAGQPSQPTDPTAQAPATRAPTTPPTFPTSEAKAQPNRTDAKVYIGTIVNTGDSFVLKSANEEYLLDNQTKAKKYGGKDVQIMGTLDKDKKLIHIKQIKLSPSM
jgi:hypothetical protein